MVLSSILISCAELAIPKFIQYFIDELFTQRHLSRFRWFIVIIAVVFSLLSLLTILKNTLRRHLQEKAARDMQYSIFSHLRKLGFAYYEQHPTGETLSLLNTEVAALQQLYRQHFPMFLEGVIFSAISLGMMLNTNVKLSLFVLPCFLLYYIFGPSLERKTSEWGKHTSQSRIQENQKVYETISSLNEIRLFSSEQWDLKRYLNSVSSFNDKFIRMHWYACMRGTNRRLTYNIGAIILLVYGFNLIQLNEITLGALVSFLLYYFVAMDRLTRLVTTLTEQKVLMYQAERLHSFMQQQPEVSEPENPVQIVNPQGVISITGVRYGYFAERPVIRDLNITIQSGQKVAFVGTSGTGKSTILKLIGRFYDPQEGQITFDGIPVQQLSFASLHNWLGYVFQDTFLFGTSVKENIRFGNPEASDDEVEAAAKAAYAHNFIAEFPDGYNTQIGERGLHLSGGQKQRIAIARMLIKNPKVVLLDEATSALDNTSEIEVQKAMDHLLVGRTIIAVAHRLSTIEHFDNIVIIDQGTVLEQGTYKELMAAKGAFFQLKIGSKEDTTEKERNL